MDQVDLWDEVGVAMGEHFVYGWAGDFGQALIWAVLDLDVEDWRHSG